MAVLQLGTMMLVRIFRRLAPSIKADSSSSKGMVMMNWRMKKMPKAPPKKLGTIKGLSVLIQWMARNMRKRGMIVT